MTSPPPPRRGRPPAHGEPTINCVMRLPLTLVATLDAIGPTRTAAVIRMVRQSAEFRERRQ